METIKIKVNFTIEHIASQGSTYSGPVDDDDVPQGIGRLVTSQGATFTGKFVNGLLNGRGIAKDPRGDVFYSGFFMFGKFHGKGKLHLGRGLIYEGDFIGGEKHGKGKLYQPMNVKIRDKIEKGKDHVHVIWDGGWINDKIQGQGTYCFREGHKFVGNMIHFHTMKWSGVGTMYWKGNDKDTYTGLFLDGMAHGKGKCSFLDGSSYEGNMKSGVRTGQGVYTFKNGDNYVSLIDRTSPGMLPYVALIGLIKHIHSSGQKHVQTLPLPSQDTVISVPYMGSCNFYDRSTYYGFIRNKIPTGQGTFNFSNGDVYRSIIDRSKPGTLPYKVLIGLIKDIHKNAHKRLTKLNVLGKNGINIDAYKYKK